MDGHSISCLFLRVCLARVFPVCPEMEGHRRISKRQQQQEKERTHTHTQCVSARPSQLSLSLLLYFLPSVSVLCTPCIRLHYLLRSCVGGSSGSSRLSLVSIMSAGHGEQYRLGQEGRSTCSIRIRSVRCVSRFLVFGDSAARCARGHKNERKRASVPLTPTIHHTMYIVQPSFCCDR